MTLKWGWVSINAKCSTYLKKRPVVTSELNFDERANVSFNTSIFRCKVIDRKNGHTFLKFHEKLGDWWVDDNDWWGLTTEMPETPYMVKGDLRYLKNFPYAYQETDGESWVNSHAVSLSMCLQNLHIPAINTSLDYLNIVNRYEKPTYYSSHRQAMKSLGVAATLNKSADSDFVKSAIDKGQPAVICLLIKGHYSEPKGRRHYVVVTGYSNNDWLVQDPCGILDLENGGWQQLDSDIGKNVRYAFKFLNPRFQYEGGATGIGWFNFRRL